MARARLVGSDDHPTPKQRVDSPKSPAEGPAHDRVIIDPSKGGAVAPKTESKSKALEVQSGHWVWDGLVKLLEVDLFSAAWEVRHGAAMALREVLKLQGRYGGMKGEWPRPLDGMMSLTTDRSGPFMGRESRCSREVVQRSRGQVSLHLRPRPFWRLRIRSGEVPNRACVDRTH